MPHNRTRMWVGLAIIAVTIPALGHYLQRSEGQDERAQGYLQQARWNATTSRYETRNSAMRLANDGPNRDYLSEVNAAIGQRGTVFADGQAYPYDNGLDYVYDSGPAAPEYPAADYRDVEDEFFDITPGIGPVYTDDRLPDPAAMMAPEPGLVAPPLGTAEDGEAVEASDDVAMEDDAVYGGGLTDGAVYATVVNNLPAEDRDEFVRVWAAMTPEQRAELLDSWRGNLTGNNP